MNKKLMIWFSMMMFLVIPIYALDWSAVADPTIVSTDNHIYDDFSINDSIYWSRMAGSVTQTDKSYIIYDLDNNEGRFSECIDTSCAGKSTLWQYNKKRDLIVPEGKVSYMFKNDPDDGLLQSFIGKQINDSDEYTRGIWVSILEGGSGANDHLVVACHNTSDGTQLDSDFYEVTPTFLFPETDYLLKYTYDLDTVNALLYDIDNMSDISLIRNVSLSGCHNTPIGNISILDRMSGGDGDNVWMVDNLRYEAHDITIIDALDNMSTVVNRQRNETYQYNRWYVDDNLVQDGGDTFIVPVENGSIVHVNVSIYVYGDLTSYLTPDYLITTDNLPNIKPTLSSGDFNQSLYEKSEDITYWITVNDTYSGDVNVRFEWYVDSVLVRNNTVIGGAFPQNLSDSLSYTEFGGSDNVSIIMYGDDGELLSDPYHDSTIISPNNEPELSDGCDDVTIYHSQNLSCQYSVTDPDDTSFNYYVNDTRVNVTGSGLVYDNPDLSDYNVDIGCYIIEVNVTDNDDGWDSDSFRYCIDNSIPSVSYSLLSFYPLGEDVDVTVSVSDFENDIMNLTYIWYVEGDLISSGYHDNLSDGDIRYLSLTDTGNYSDNDDIILNISISDSIGESYTDKTSIFREQSTNFLSENYCPDDLEGVGLLFLFLIILIFFVMVDMMITLPILGILAGIGFIAIGMIFIACYPLLGILVAGFGVLYIAYNAFIRDF